MLPETLEQRECLTILRERLQETPYLALGSLLEANAYEKFCEPHTVNRRIRGEPDRRL